MYLSDRKEADRAIKISNQKCLAIRFHQRIAQKDFGEDAWSRYHQSKHGFQFPKTSNLCIVQTINYDISDIDTTISPYNRATENHTIISPPPCYCLGYESTEICLQHSKPRPKQFPVNELVLRASTKALTESLSEWDTTVQAEVEIYAEVVQYYDALEAEQEMNCNEWKKWIVEFERQERMERERMEKKKEKGSRRKKYSAKKLGYRWSGSIWDYCLQLS